MRKRSISVLISLFLLTSVGVKGTLLSDSHQWDLPAQAANLGDNAYPTLTSLEQTRIPDADLVDLAIRLLHVEAISPPPMEAPLRQIGDQARFNASNSGGGYSFEVDATLHAIGDHIYMWVEDGINIAVADLEELTNAWDERIYFQVRELWGSEALPGIDGDHRVHALFARDLGAGVAAYFGRRNIYPAEVAPSSNEREMFFMNLDSIGSQISDEYVEGVVAHEFQHMIRANVDANEITWLDEGFSTFTELYLGYTSPLWFGDAFLAAPDTQLNTFAENSMSRTANYGGGLLFVTYFFERFGLPGIQTLSADPATGMVSVNNVLSALGQTDSDAFFADWVLANYIQDSTVGNGRYGYTLLIPSRTPALNDSIESYPYMIEDVLSQYGTHYYHLSGLSDYTKLHITLEIPETVALIPTFAPSGSHMWYSNRGDISNPTLTQTFNLTEVDSATLNYKAWYAIEHEWDYAYITVSTNGSKHWDILAAPNSTTSNPFDTAYGPGYTGQSGRWLDQTISLDAYAGQEIALRFEMVTDDAVNLHGLAIDDVTIPEIGYASDFEADDGGWQAAGWLRMDNILPQQAWVQTIQFAGDAVIIKRWRVPDDNTSWTLPLADDLDSIIIAVSPFAPVTTVPTQYKLTITAAE